MNGAHEKLSACQRRMVDDNRPWLNKNLLIVIKSSIEMGKTGKRKRRLTIVVEEEDENGTRTE